MASTNQATSRRRVAPNFSLKSLPVDAKLTSREKAVLAAVLVGLTNKEIGRALDISSRTVEFHRANLLKKYDARNTADLVRRVLGQ